MSQFQKYKEDVSGIKLPDKFTFPFYYDPHPLAIIAAKELQLYLEGQTDFEHNFGLDENQAGEPKGKMFGVLVVKNQENEIGYLNAFSGYLADKSLPERFVPPLFDMYAEHGFYVEGENELDAINQQIEDLENEPHFIELKKIVNSKYNSMLEELKQQKEGMRLAKKERKVRRKEAAKTLSEEVLVSFNEKLNKESANGRIFYKELSEKLKQDLLICQNKLEAYSSKINKLKAERKNKSAILQQKIFDQYQFLNQQKIPKRLTEIFPNLQKTPAGAGDCSAPKLLQYAFSNNLVPIAMAEFWWGASPKTEIRKHKNFYPACQGRCKPILSHMLEGIAMNENPILKKAASKKEIKIIFEDDSLIVVNKPASFLSVPGKDVSDSVYSQIKSFLPNATGPLIVHRLDMATSGILLIAKTKDVHKILQSQFIKRTVKKRYTALLDGIIEQDEGYVDLPLRVDLNDRPRQLVCYDFGKKAKTRFHVIERFGNKTRVHLFPITGRTHQLRVHAAHSLGLNMPIVGDELYGAKSDRLYLHAEYIEFVHPVIQKKMSFTVKADF